MISEINQTLWFNIWSLISILLLKQPLLLIHAQIYGNICKNSKKNLNLIRQPSSNLSWSQIAYTLKCPEQPWHKISHYYRKYTLSLFWSLPNPRYFRMRFNLSKQTQRMDRIPLITKATKTLLILISSFSVTYVWWWILSSWTVSRLLLHFFMCFFTTVSKLLLHFFMCFFTILLVVDISCFIDNYTNKTRTMTIYNFTKTKTFGWELSAPDINW